MRLTIGTTPDSLLLCRSERTSWWGSRASSRLQMIAMTTAAAAMDGDRAQPSDGDHSGITFDPRIAPGGRVKLL